MKILLTDYSTLQSNDDLNMDILDKFGRVERHKNITHDQLIKASADADVILCNKTIIDREIFNSAEKLKYIGLFATGFNNVDIAEAKRRNIPVCNAGGYSTNAVVQQVIGYILIHYTNIPKYNEFVHNGGWKSADVFSPLVYPSDEVCGKTLGIIGYGNIGKAVKKAAEGIGMKVIVNTRTPGMEKDTVYTDLDTLLSTSDVVSVHCPLNEQSRDMMNRDAFMKMKKGAFFINTARGGIVDEFALFYALESGWLSGAALDVLKEEPMTAGCPLATAKNLIITPHTAWAPLATRKRLLKIVAENLSAFLQGNTQNNVAE